VPVKVKIKTTKLPVWSSKRSLNR